MKKPPSELAFLIKRARRNLAQARKLKTACGRTMEAQYKCELQLLLRCQLAEARVDLLVTATEMTLDVLGDKQFADPTALTDRDRLEFDAVLHLVAALDVARTPKGKKK